ncbi:vanadium-dependent haloperoxidase [Aetokthonos hydrillicola Thurmond2011]|uniref:Vanadium-dependent haloperoxidase n=2 Tax=Aetokthonos TaxID=1550243 RepID=A0AAP5I8L5_9CYAN|nr:vanadium-dependent haloperoxidase [Aetokthonos hydrillicola CCALA 1050]MDR9896876.1 vanadium-dependent haloperoxidase [Aetokthonos hydrillicola Thurmond2011]
MFLNYAVFGKEPKDFAQKINIVAVNSNTDNLEHLVNQLNQLPDAKDRRDQAFLIRLKAALLERNNFSFNHPNNGDERVYASQNYIANFTKALPHNELGVVDPSAYSAELKALDTGKFEDFEAIPLGGTTKLANPQAAYAFDLEGIDSHGLTIPPPPTFSSAETASEIAEDYWQALTRDVPFSEYENNPDTQAAASDLSHFSDFRGPKQNGQVTTGTLFRSDIAGTLIGPYVSQFLWLDVPYGVGVTSNYPTNDGQLGVGVVPVPTNSQQRNFAAPGIDYLTDRQQWLNNQNGQPAPNRTQLDPQARYIHTNRDLIEYTHRDYPYLTFINTALLLLGQGPGAIAPNNPYLSAKVQAGGTTLGARDLLDQVARVANQATKAVWYQKWLVHRRLRPEAFAGWIDNQKKGLAKYLINEEILNSPVLERIFNKYGSYLLPQAFPEGSPVHPAYPSGHATYTGASVTVLKAFFNESFVLLNPVVASDDGLSLRNYSGSSLTVGGELNKLASNIVLARDAAGIHWRSDAIAGLKLGEALAISILQDRSKLYNEPFSGFTLTKFDGQRITIKDGTVIPQ